MAVGSPVAGVCYALVSLILSVAGLCLLQTTRPSRAVDTHIATLFGFTYRAVGVFGALLLFLGLVFSAIPWLTGVFSHDEGRAAAVVLCLLAPALWAVERLLPGPRQDPKRRRFHGVGCAVVWFGSTLIEWAAARPHDSLVKGLGGQIAGCDGGYRSPFLIYASMWLTCLTFGAIFLCLISLPGTAGDETATDSEEVEVRHSFLGGGSQKKRKGDHALRCKALPVIYGFATSMACLAFALGVTLNSMRWVGFGSFLLAIAVICAWQWLWYLELTLAHWAVASQAMATWLRNLQAHLWFRDFRWTPFGEEAGRLLAVWKYPGIWIYLLGFFLTSAVCAFVMAAPALIHQSREIDGIGAPPQSRARKAASRAVVNMVVCLQWIVFGVMLTFYYLGVTRPLMETRFELPELHYVHLGPGMAEEAKAATSGPMNEDMHMNPGGSYMRLITTLYDDRLPCSAMVISFNTVVRAPMQVFTFLAVKLRPSFMSVGLLQNLQAIWIEHQAPGWFCNPMVLMMLVSLINLTGPSGSLYHSTFGRGFWFFLTYATSSVFNAWLFMAFPETGAFAANTNEGGAKKRSMDMRTSALTASKLHEVSRDDSIESFSSPHKPGYEAMMIEDAEAGTEESSSESDSEIIVSAVKRTAAALGICVLLVLLATATYLGLTRPFLDFEYRLSGVAMKKATPTVLELLYGIGDTCRYLQVFAALTLVGALVAWVPLFIVRLTLQTADGERSLVTEVARILEVSVRPWVMIDIWAFSVLLVYYVVTARNKGVVEVCAALPKFPIGLMSIFCVFFTTKAMKHLAREVMPSAITALHHHHGAGRGAALPGGNGLWVAMMMVTGMCWVALLYNHAPVATPSIQNLYDLNQEVEVLLPETNRRLKEKLPRSAGDCHALWLHQVSNGDPSSYQEFRSVCRGQKALAQVQEENLFGEATWATGLDSLEFVQVHVQSPAGLTSGSRRWNATIRGRFTNLHIWLKVNQNDMELVNDYMCCHNPFNFAIEASVDCHDGHGFGGVHLEVVQIDPIEFEHQMQMSTDPLDETSLQVNYGSYKAVETAVRDFLTMKTGHFLLKNPDGSVTDPLDSAGGYLQSIVELNTGHQCLQADDAFGLNHDTRELWREPFV